MRACSAPRADQEADNGTRNQMALLLPGYRTQFADADRRRADYRPRQNLSPMQAIIAPPRTTKDRLDEFPACPNGPGSYFRPSQERAAHIYQCQHLPK